MEALSERGRWTDLAGPVFYCEWPGPPDRTFVLLHGLGGSHANWMRIGPALAHLGEVLAFDFAGSGFTPRSGRSSGVPASRELLSRFIAEVARQPVVLCGNSLGGSIALLQAACEPDSVAGVVLNGAALPPAPGERVPPVVLAGTGIYTLPLVGLGLGWLRLKGLPAATLIRAGFGIVMGDSSRVPEDVVSVHIDMARSQREDPDAVAAFVQTTASILSMMSRPDLAHSYMDAVACPVLMMHGGKDRVVPAKPTVAAAPQDWDVRVFPDLGHVIQLEAPDVWLATVEDWLGGSRQGADGSGGL